MTYSRSVQTLLAVAFFAAVALPMTASAQVPPRFYWKSLVGGNALPVIYMNMSGNANPLDPASTVFPEASFDASVAMAGYAKTFTLFDKSALVAGLLPMGKITGQGSVLGRTFSQSADGFGDPTLEFVINMVGPPPIKGVPDALRYEPGFSMDLLVDVIVPVGEYDSNEPLNLGQNRWYGRVGAPIVWQFGDWVPGRRTTLEFLPSVWMFSDNDNLMGHRLSTDPKYQLETHLTRDFHPNLWGSFDTNWVSGGAASIDGSKGEELDMFGVGFTLGYQVNDHIQLTAGYMASSNENSTTELQMDGFKLSLVFGWHPLVEGMKRLGGE